MAKRLSRSATLIQTLVFYDGPQIALFETDIGYKLIALAIGNPTPSQNIFLGCQVRDQAFRAYKNGKVDLNFLFRFSTGRRLYVLNWSELDDGIVSLKTAPDRIVNGPENFPDRGFFQEDHTEEWNTITAPSVRRQYGIAGRWEASDFSRFYAKLGDMYAFLSLIEDLENEDLGNAEHAQIVKAMNEPSFAGGGSYVGFYSDLRSHAQEIRPLRIASIEYHSPGHIEVEGRATVFRELAFAFSAIDEKSDLLKSLYKTVNSILSNEQLRTADRDADFSNNKIKHLAYIRTVALAENMNISDPAGLLKACDGNVLVFSKIVLSYFRRLRDLHTFQKEGRLTITSEDAANTPSTAATPGERAPPKRP